VFVTTRTKPGNRMMGKLELWVEVISGEFNSQEVANTMWEVSFFHTRFNFCSECLGPCV
jgi:hypothetical protein